MVLQQGQLKLQVWAVEGVRYIEHQDTDRRWVTFLAGPHLVRRELDGWEALHLHVASA